MNKKGRGGVFLEGPLCLRENDSSISKKKKIFSGRIKLEGNTRKEEKGNKKRPITIRRSPPKREKKLSFAKKVRKKKRKTHLKGKGDLNKTGEGNKKGEKTREEERFPAKRGRGKVELSGLFFREGVRPKGSGGFSRRLSGGGGKGKKERGP